VSDLARFAACGLVELRTDGTIADANETFADWVGLPVDQLAGRPLTSFIDESQATPTIAEPRDSASGPSGGRSVTVRLMHADGTSRPVLISWSRRAEQVSVAVFDATQRQEFEDRMLATYSSMERNGRRLGLLLSAAVTFADAQAPDEVAELLAETVRSAYAATDSAVFLVDDEQRIRHAAGRNPFGVIEGGAGLVAEALKLRNVLTVSSVSASETLAPPVREALRAADVEGLLLAPIFHDATLHGVFAALFAAVRPFDDQAVPLAEALGRQAAQVLSRLQLQQQLQRLALHDETTGLPNRRMLEERIDAYARSAGVLLAVIFLDIDGFKAVNDQLGHAAGDALLRTIGQRMQAVIREPDTVARFGGDEFVAVCEVTDVASAQSIAERLREAVSAPYPHLPAQLQVGVSVGVAVADGREASLRVDQLVRVADHAMYTAKTTGGNRVVLQTV
jgi:diguanylate cyclase (GGDEF)-like protein